MRKHQVEPYLLCYYKPLVNAIQEKNIFQGKKRETTCDVIPELSIVLLSCDPPFFQRCGQITPLI